jgi:hypothetical protein
MLISTGLKIPYSFLYRKYINYIHLLNFIIFKTMTFDQCLTIKIEALFSLDTSFSYFLKHNFFDSHFILTCHS